MSSISTTRDKYVIVTSEFELVLERVLILTSIRSESIKLDLISYADLDALVSI